ncbi:hypothetical protein DFH09DRAFT_1282993 [Mycena vulgaris]|nr:hypothetical protein DFH09DRAFT_1282993 [Mycena vulgaris]
MSLPLTEAQLLGNWFETLTYGMYFITCGFCARTFLCIGPDDRWRKPSEIRGFILSVYIALFVGATFDVVIGLLHNLHAFVFYTGGGGAAQVLVDISNWINIARSVAQVIQMILGDFVLMYRCYIVYSRRWKVLIPSLILYLGGIAMGIKLIEAQVSLHHANATMISPEIRPWWFTLFCITVTHQAIGIAFNVIIMRSSPSRDKQFTVFEANERAAAETGALTRLRFSSRSTNYRPSLTTVTAQSSL